MDSLITLYNDIRKIPYKIVDIEYNLFNSYRLIRDRGASCTPKHVVLGDWFGGLNLEYNFLVHEFNWKDFKITAPGRLSDLINIMPNDYHTNLKVKISEEWVLVDATWDDSLIKFGFPGTMNWNGKGDTNNGVYALQQFEFSTLEERTDFVKSAKETSEYDTEFISELNNFFEVLRSNKVLQD